MKVLVTEASARLLNFWLAVSEGLLTEDSTLKEVNTVLKKYRPTGYLKESAQLQDKYKVQLQHADLCLAFILDEESKGILAKSYGSDYYKAVARCVLIYKYGYTLNVPTCLIQEIKHTEVYKPNTECLDD